MDPFMLYRRSCTQNYFSIFNLRLDGWREGSPAQDPASRRTLTDGVVGTTPTITLVSLKQQKWRKKERKKEKCLPEVFGLHLPWNWYFFLEYLWICLASVTLHGLLKLDVIPPLIITGYSNLFSYMESRAQAHRTQRETYHREFKRSHYRNRRDWFVVPPTFSTYNPQPGMARSWLKQVIS